MTSQRAALSKRLPTHSLPTRDSVPTVHLSRPDEMILVVPHLLGFWPDRSIVVVLLVDGRVEVTARADLDCSPVELAEVIQPMIARCPHHRVLLIGYGQRDRVEDAVRAAEMLFAPDTLIDSLGTDGRRWWSRGGAGGVMSARDLREIGLSVPALAAGLLPDRSALERQFAGPPPDRRQGLAARLDDLLDSVSRSGRADRMERVTELIRHAVAVDRVAGLDDDQRLELAALVQDIATRDTAWMAITRGEAAEHLALWRSVLDLTPAPQAPPVLCLAATAGWLAGNGAIMNICLERALDIQPTYSLAKLLTDVMRQAIAPSAWDRLAGLSVDPAEYGDEP